MAKRKPTEAERAENAASRQQALADARRLRELAERAQAEPDAAKVAQARRDA